MARAYLAALRHAGAQPRRLVLMVSRRHPSTGKPLGRWLPESLRRRYAEKVQRASHCFWARWLYSMRRPFVDELIARVGRELDLPPAVFHAVLGKSPLEDYAPHVDRVLVDGLKDPALRQALETSKSTAVLFTGGGIVPETLLSIPETKLLHVHPGLLPYVRGADGLLWSTLVRGRPGGSCFYMAPGLDTGDVVFAKEFPSLTMPRRLAAGLDDIMLYRAIFSFYDPMVRARVLLSVLELGNDLRALPSEPQDLTRGVTYHFMHPRVRRAALDQIFVDSE